MGALDDLRERARRRRVPRSVHVEEIDADLLVRPMSGADLSLFVADMAPEDGTDAQAFETMRRWVARLVVGDDGEPLFAGPMDEVLGEFSVPQLLAVFGAVVGAAGVSDVKDAAGKAAATRTGTGGSG